MSRPSSVRLTFYIFIIYVIPSHVDSLVVLSLLPRVIIRTLTIFLYYKRIGRFTIFQIL